MILFKKYYIRKLSKLTTAVLAVAIVLQNVFFGIYAIATEGNITEYVPNTVSSLEDTQSGLYWHKISNALKNELPYTASVSSFNIQNSAILSVNPEAPKVPVDMVQAGGGGSIRTESIQEKASTTQEVTQNEEEQSEDVTVEDSEPQLDEPEEETVDVSNDDAQTVEDDDADTEVVVPSEETEVSVPDEETELVGESVEQSDTEPAEATNEEVSVPAPEPEPEPAPVETPAETSWLQNLLFASNFIHEAHAEELVSDIEDTSTEDEIVTSSLVFSGFGNNSEAATLKNIRIKLSLSGEALEGAQLVAHYSFDGNVWDKTAPISLSTAVSNNIVGDYFYLSIPHVPVGSSIKDLSIRLEYSVPKDSLETAPGDILLQVDSLSLIEDRSVVAKFIRKIEELLSPEYVEFTDTRTPEELKNARIQYANDIFELLKNADTDEPFQILSKEFDSQTPLELSLIGASPDAQALYQDGKVTYVDIYQNTDFIYTPTGTGLKEEILLKTEEHPNLFTYSLNLSDFDYEQTSDNVIEVYQKGFVGNPLKKLYEITAPYMEDATGARSENITLVIVEDEMRLIPDPEFLEQATYPVLVDPTITISVLTVYAHPLSGEDWTVDFATVGTSDLRIIPRTEATIDDIDFTSLVCDGEERIPQILDNEVIYYPDWSCDGVGTVVHHVEQEGSHILDFEFGGGDEEVVTSTAFNGTYTWDGGGATNNWSECANWTTDVCPRSTDAVVFDTTSTKDATLDNATTVTSMTISSGYTGTITQGDGNNLTITGTFSQADGVFQGGLATTTISNTYTLSGGTFNGGSGTLSHRDTSAGFTISGGTFNAPSTTEFTGIGFGYTVNVNSTQTFENLRFNKTQGAQGITLGSGDTFIVTGTTTIQDGFLNTGTIEARGDVVVSSTFDGGSTALLFSGSSTSGLATQTFDLTGATELYNGDITINKSEGELRLASALIMNAASQDLVLTNGTLYLNGYNLAVSGSSGTFTVADGATFKLQGGERLTFNTNYPSFASGAITEYIGDGDGAADTFDAQSFTYADLVINTTDTGDTIDAENPLDSNLQGYWNMDEASGTSLADSSGYGRTATVAAGASVITGQYNNGRDFNASNESATFSTISVPEAHTISFWAEFPVPASAGGYRTFVARSGGFFHHVILDGNGILGIWNNAGYWTGYDTDVLSGWHHVVAVASGGTTKFYIDGSLVGTANSQITADISIFGNQATNGSQNAGKMDELRIYSTALDTNQIASLYNDNALAFYSSGVDVENFTLSSGTFIAPTTTMTVSGNFTNNGGTFTHNSGTTAFDGTNQTISGSTTFYNLSKTLSSAADTLTFEAGSTQTVAGNLTFTGATGLLSDYLLSLRSSSGGSQWNIDPQGNRSVSYLDVQDSNNINATAIEAGNFTNTNSGNNTNWNFDPTFTQGDYQFFANADSLTPGSSLGIESATTTLTSTSSPVRLRMNIIADTFFATSTAQFKLQVATTTTGIWYTLNPQSDWWDADFTNRRKIYIDNTASAENLTDFPLLVELNSSRIDYTKTQNSGEDIRFVDSDNSTELNYEIEVWNESGTSTVWVKVPQIDAGSDNTDYIWMYYNNASATDNATTTGVWDSSFQGVWHLADGSTLDVSDSAEATPTTNVGATAVAGEVDGGADFASDYIYATDKAGFRPAQNITISAWVNPDTAAAWGKIFGKDYRADGTWNSPYLSYDFSASNSTTGRPYWGVNLSGTNYGVTAPSALTNGTWNHVVGTYDGSNLRLYVNGTQVGTTTQAGTINYPVTADIAIGGRSRYSPGDYFDGKLDEVRFSNTTRSAEWIEAEYLTVRDTMNTFASEETVSAQASDIWSLTSNASATDGAELPSLLLSSSNIAGTYAETNPTATNPNAAAAGQYIEFDFTLDPTNMILDTYYYFRLIFANGTTLGSYTSYPTLTIASNQSPGTPSSLGPSGLTDGSWTTDNTPDLTFTTSDADGDNVQYHILIDDSSDFSSPIVDYTSASGSAGASTFTVGQAAGGGTYTTGSSGQTLSDSSGYYWRVSTTDSNGGTSATTTANSGSIAFRVDTTAPTAGTVTLSATSTSGFTVTTTAGSDATSGLSATPYNFSNTTTGEYTGATTSLSWSPTGLDPNTQYTFAVSVTDTAGNAATSTTISGYTLANTPTSLSASADSSTAITASWGANSNPSGTEYYVENVTSGTSSGWTTSTSYAFTGLTCDTTYEFKVKARNGDSTETSYTSTVSVSTDACQTQGAGGSSQPVPGGGANGNGQSNGGGGGGGQSCLANMVPTGESVDVDFSQAIQKSWERSFTQILIDNGYSNPQKILSNQFPYEQWGVADFTSVNFEVKLLAHEGAYHSTFGYYDAGKPNTFVPIGKTGNIFGFATAPTVPVGGSTSFALNAANDSFGMSIRAYSGTVFAGQFYTEDKLNPYGGPNQTAIFKVDDGYIIGFEDLPVSLGGDKDYNDVVLLVRPVACSYYEPTGQQPPTDSTDTYRIFINNDQETTTRGDVFVGFDVPDTVRQVALSNNTGFGGADRVTLPLVYSWDICNRGSSQNAKNPCKAGEYTVYARFYNAAGEFVGSASDSIEYSTQTPPPTEPPIGTGTTTNPGGETEPGGIGTVIEEVIGGVTGGVETIVETITEAVTETGSVIEEVLAYVGEAFASVSTYVAQTELNGGVQDVTSSTQRFAKETLGYLPLSSQTITASAVLGTVLVAPAAMFARVIGVAMSTANSATSTANFLLIVWRFLNHLQELFGLRKRRNRWGVVYDAQEKIPLHPVKVELISMQTQKVVETAITDHSGGYGFLPRDGVFAFNVKHPAYTFPSHLVTKGPDGVFGEVYTGKAITMKKEHEPHDLNIPIDKLSEQAIVEHRKFELFGFGMRRFGTFMAEAIFWVTFVFIVVTFFAEPVLLNGFLVLFYIAIIGIKHNQTVYHSHRFWGRIIAEQYQKEMEEGQLYVVISDALDPQDVPRQTRVNKHGKFYFKTDKEGTFDVVVKLVVGNKEQVLEHEKVVVGEDRLVTHTLLIS